MTNIKRTIGQMQDVTELRQLKKAILERIDVLEKRAYAAKVEAAWERVKDLPKGTMLHVCSTGTFFGGPFQRGDSFKITYVQPRARRIWIEHKGVVNGAYFDARNVERYDLRTEPPADPMKPEHRAEVDLMAARVQEALS